MTGNLEIIDRRRHVFALKAAPEAAPAARNLVTTALTGWRAAHLMDDALLIVSELVSNALEHGTGPKQKITLVVSLAPEGRVAVEVWDGSSESPVAGQPDVDSVDGRGLFIVSALAREWGWRPTANGKVVWAVVGA